eukprot:1917836-Amphidinium_carterae.1
MGCFHAIRKLSCVLNAIAWKLVCAPLAFLLYFATRPLLKYLRPVESPQSVESSCTNSESCKDRREEL